jgi:hypothetical protein
MARLQDPLLWSTLALVCVAVALALGLRRSRAATSREARRRAAVEAARRESLERTAAEIAVAARGLLGSASTVRSTSTEAVESVRATTSTVAHLTQTAMTAALAAETVIGLALRSEKAAVAALAELDRSRAGEPAGEEVARRSGEAIQDLAAALRESAIAARQIAQVAQQQGANFDEVLQALNAIYLATEKSLASNAQVAREARSLDDLASSLRRSCVPAA